MQPPTQGSWQDLYKHYHAYRRWRWLAWLSIPLFPFVLVVDFVFGLFYGGVIVMGLNSMSKILWNRVFHFRCPQCNNLAFRHELRDVTEDELFKILWDPTLIKKRRQDMIEQGGHPFIKESWKCCASCGTIIEPETKESASL